MGTRLSNHGAGSRNKTHRSSLGAKRLIRAAREGAKAQIADRSRPNPTPLPVAAALDGCHDLGQAGRALGQAFPQ